MDGFHQSILSKNRSYLEDNLSMRDVIDSLLTREAITDKHKQTIEAQDENFLRVRKLVDILLLLPERNFLLFCEAVSDSGYPHVKAKLLADYPMSPTGLLIDGPFSFKQE